MRKKVPSYTRTSNLKQRAKKKTDKHKATKKRRYAIVRIIGHGQFRVNNSTAKKISKIDNELIKIIEMRKQGEEKYSKRVAEVLRLVKKDGLPLEHREIIQSDIIVPGADISIEEAKNLFTGQPLTGGDV
jgi:hypothetical protein